MGNTSLTDHCENTGRILREGELCSQTVIILIIFIGNSCVWSIYE